MNENPPRSRTSSVKGSRSNIKRRTTSTSAKSRRAHSSWLSPYAAAASPAFFSTVNPHTFNQRRVGSAYRFSQGSTPFAVGSSNSAAPQSKITYIVAVTTGDIPDAGTSAPAYITLKGSNFQSIRRRLYLDTSIEFTPGTTHVFSIDSHDLGDIQYIVIEHTGLDEKDSWFVQSVEVLNSIARKSHLFICNQWLSLEKGNGKTSQQVKGVRSGKTTYEIVIDNISKDNLNLTSKLFIAIYGDRRITPWIALEKQNQDDPCTNDQSTVKSTQYFIRAPVAGAIEKIRIQHDSRGDYPHIYIERIVVRDLAHPENKFFFNCDQWLSSSQGDGQICRDLFGSCDPRDNPYEVTIYTGNQTTAGTSALVYLQLNGKRGESNKKFIRGNFSRGSVDKIVIFSRPLKGIESVLLGHDNSGVSPSWFVEKIIINDFTEKKLYEFPCNKWFVSDKEDFVIERELFVKGSKSSSTLERKQNHEKNTKKSIASRQRKVQPPGHSQHSLNHENEEEVNEEMILNEKAPQNSVRPPFKRAKNKIKANADDKDAFDMLDEAPWDVVTSGGRRPDESDSSDEVEAKEKIKLERYHIHLLTSELGNIESDLALFVNIIGEKGESGEKPLANLVLQESGNINLKGKMSEYDCRIESEDFGKILKLRVYGGSLDPNDKLFLDEIIVWNENEPNTKVLFECQKWLEPPQDENQNVQEIDGINVNELNRYHVQLFMARDKEAGENANFFINIIGDARQSGQKKLINLNNDKKRFAIDNMEEFNVLSKDLGVLLKVNVGHDNENVGCGWFLDEVIVWNEDEGEEAPRFVFNCRRWLDTEKEDGLIVRELEGVIIPDCIILDVTVKTGKIAFAGTNANAFLTIFGRRGQTRNKPLKPANRDVFEFKRGQSETFKLQSSDLGDLIKITLNHDGTEKSQDWYVENMEIYVEHHHRRYIVDFKRWIKGGESLAVTLPLKPDTQDDYIERFLIFDVSVYTSDLPYAGTHANVFLQMCGKNNLKTNEIQLTNGAKNFERGATDKFQITALDVGPIEKILIRHNGEDKEDNWFLKKMCIRRHLIKGCRRRVRMLLFRSPDSKKSSSNKKMLNEKGSLRSRGQNKSNRKTGGPAGVAGGGGGGAGASGNKKSKIKEKTADDGEDDEWIEEEEKYWFMCNQWLLIKDENRGVHKLELFPELEYFVTVKLGDITNNVSDTNLIITLIGDKAESGEKELQRKIISRSKFERRKGDQYKIKANDLGELNKIVLRFESSEGIYFVDFVTVLDFYNQREYYFPCGEKLPADEDVEFEVGIKPVEVTAMAIFHSKKKEATYHIRVTTGDKWGAGTDCSVYIILFGKDENQTDKILLKKSITNRNKFERKQTDEFIVITDDVGEISRIKIGLDNPAKKENWFLDKVEVENKSPGNLQGKIWLFEWNEWIGYEEGEGQLECELYPELGASITYEVTTYTSDLRGAGSSANVYIQIYGQTLHTKRKFLCPKGEREGKFQRGKEDSFILHLKNVEKIKKIRIGHDNDGLTPGWHLDRVRICQIVDETKGLTSYEFKCKKWLARDEDDFATDREMTPESIIREFIQPDGKFSIEKVDIGIMLPIKKYKIFIYTNRQKTTNNDGNIYLTLCGSDGDSGERQLVNSSFLSIQSINEYNWDAVDLGILQKLKVRYENTSSRSAAILFWYLEKIKIIDCFDNDKVYSFYCGNWLPKDRSENEKFKSVLYSNDFSIPYMINVLADDKHAMNVSWVNIYGTDVKCTGMLPLQVITKDKNDLGSFKKFGVYALDVGDVRKVEIGNNCAEEDSALRINEIRVEQPTKGKIFLFPTYELNEEKKGFQTFERNTRDPETESSNDPRTLFEITIFTGGDKEAGTDSTVFLQIFGDKGSAKELEIPSVNGRFQPLNEDFIRIVGDDVGKIIKMRIRIDEKGSRPNWFLEKVELRNMSSNDLYTFDVQQWLGRKQGVKGTLQVDIPACLNGEEHIPSTDYEISVKTSDISGAGTDAHVFIRIFGEYGDSGDLQLARPDDDTEPFEQDKIDNFTFNDIISLGELGRCRIWHDNRDFGSSWHLEYVEIKDLNHNRKWKFPCNKWLSTNEHVYRDLLLDIEEYQRETDSNIILLKETYIEKIKQLTVVTYQVSVFTGDKVGSGTDSNVFITIYGPNGDTGIRPLKQKGLRDLFRQGQKDEFELESIDLGEIKWIRIEHDGTGVGSDWFLDHVEVKNMANEKAWKFNSKQWLSIEKHVRRMIKASAMF